jgi:WD domain, G-beta repeat/WD40-like Beta Propeller Repeat
LTSGGDGRLRLWDLETRRVVRELTGSTSAIGYLTFLGAGRALSHGGRLVDHTIRVWDLSRGVEERTFEGPPGNLAALDVSPDGSRLVTASADGALRVWDVAAGREVRSFDLYGLGAILDVHVSRNGQRVYAQVPGTVCAWDIEAGVWLGCAEREGWSGWGRSALSPDGRWAAFTADAGVRFWQTPEGPGPSSPPAWPSVPAWSAAADAPSLAPPAEGDRVARERAVVALAFGRVNVARLRVDAAARTTSRSMGVTVHADEPTVVGRLPKEVVHRIVRQNLGRFRLCYENGLRENPLLEGRASVHFVVDSTGSVTKVTDAGSTLDAAVAHCVVRSFEALSFPAPESGTASVTYRLSFARSSVE